jgi:hypothetical protein
MQGQARGGAPQDHCALVQGHGGWKKRAFASTSKPKTSWPRKPKSCSPIRQPRCCWARTRRCCSRLSGTRLRPAEAGMGAMFGENPPKSIFYAAIAELIVNIYRRTELPAFLQFQNSLGSIKVPSEVMQWGSFPFHLLKERPSGLSRLCSLPISSINSKELTLLGFHHF